MAWGGALVAVAMFVLSGLSATGAAAASGSNLAKAKVYLAAGDYRRALEACQREVDEKPSAAGYVYVTYVYQALDGYLAAMAKAEKWVAIEQLVLNLSTKQSLDLVDPPDIMARVAREIISESAQRQSDLHAALATKLDKAVTEKLWKQQAAWRAAHPDDWWAGVPDAWGW
ncbi:MAG: hypothetical protein A4S17_01340 [Proteobacteria bacterium HN_bin10]|nr:MAG: hypothetical protein A4S17_01340 [Proteobacteria bacterium HN_bin10]